MSWAIGYDDTWGRDIGYGVPSVCDQPGCMAVIDRGLAHVCTNEEPHGGEKGCGLYFCFAHRGERCRHKGFKPTPDTPVWMAWKLEDDSWMQWRVENPAEADVIRATLRTGEAA